MNQLVQLVPNFSEGRNHQVINQLVEVANSVQGATLIDYSADESHNRSVFTLIGQPSSIEKVAFKLIEKASLIIDMRKHQGEHPRMGATDVCPLIPLRNTSIDDCIDLSHSIGKKVGTQLKIPVFLYEASAQSPQRQNLANIRKGQYEGMKEKLLDEVWYPDYGPNQMDDSVGAIAIGARMPLIAFNVNLNTSDINIANNIAKSVRGSSGGYKYCKAMGVKIEETEMVQVSMNMTDYRKTPLYKVLETIKSEADHYGVTIVEAEIIGVAPNQALVESAKYYLQLHNFDIEKQIIENYLL